MIKPTIERAFELAGCADCKTLADIKRVLKAEHYTNIDQHLESRVLRKQLTALMRLPTEELTPRR